MKNKILGGIAIGLGAMFFLTTGEALTFTLGIIIIVSLGLPLFTGYIPLQEYLNTLSLKEGIFILIGNLIGAFGTGLIVETLPKGAQMVSKANTVISNKGMLSAEEMVISGVITGILIGIGVIAYNKRQGDLLGLVALLASITAFVALGTDHVVANAFYMGIVKCGGTQLIVLSGIGNLIGGYIAGKLID